MSQSTRIPKRVLARASFYSAQLVSPKVQSKQMNKLKVLSFLLLLPFLLVGCSSTYNPSIEADEAMPKMEDDSIVGEPNL